MLGQRPPFQILLPLWALVLPLGTPAFGRQGQSEKQAQEEAAKKAIDEFTNKYKESKTIHEQALAIQAFGEVWPKDKSMVFPLAKHLAAGPKDINYILPVTAAEALGKFRGFANAAQHLIAVLPNYKKIPYVYNKILAAIGKVGHESAFAMFDDALKGKDSGAAIAAIDAISEMPAGVALEKLFSEAERIDKAMPKASDDLKKVYEKALPELLKQIRRVSGAPYPTLAELKIWWQKKGTAFKDEAAAKEKEKASKASANFKPGIPPPLIVELLFKENAGESTSNSGTSSGLFPTATISKLKPSWTTNVPPNGGPSALDFGATSGAHFVDLGGGAGIDHLRNLRSFTITGWVNLKTDKETPGDKLVPAGQRLVSWINHGKEGVELVYREKGSLQIGINQWADQSAAASDAGQIPIVEEKPKDPAAAERANWRFFAVTYDSGTNAGHVKFYFGSSALNAKLNKAVDCDRGPVGSKIGPNLTIGNLNAPSRPMAQEKHSFRGIIDDIRIFGSTMDGTGALELAEIIKVQNRELPTP